MVDFGQVPQDMQATLDALLTEGTPTRLIAMKIVSKCFAQFGYSFRSGEYAEVMETVLADAAVRLWENHDKIFPRKEYRKVCILAHTGKSLNWCLRRACFALRRKWMQDAKHRRNIVGYSHRDECNAKLEGRKLEQRARWNSISDMIDQSDYRCWLAGRSYRDYLKDLEASEMMTAYANGSTQIEIAEQFGLSQQRVSFVLNQEFTKLKASELATA